MLQPDHVRASCFVSPFSVALIGGSLAGSAHAPPIRLAWIFDDAARRARRLIFQAEPFRRSRRPSIIPGPAPLPAPSPAPPPPSAIQTQPLPPPPGRTSAAGARRRPRQAPFSPRPAAGSRPVRRSNRRRVRRSSTTRSSPKCRRKKSTTRARSFPGSTRLRAASFPLMPRSEKPCNSVRCGSRRGPVTRVRRPRRRIPTLSLKSTR